MMKHIANMNNIKELLNTYVSAQQKFVKQKIYRL